MKKLKSKVRKMASGGSILDTETQNSKRILIGPDSSGQNQFINTSIPELTPEFEHSMPNGQRYKYNDLIKAYPGMANANVYKRTFNRLPPVRSTPTFGDGGPVDNIQNPDNLGNKYGEQQLSGMRSNNKSSFFKSPGFQQGLQGATIGANAYNNTLNQDSAGNPYRQKEEQLHQSTMSTIGQTGLIGSVIAGGSAAGDAAFSPIRNKSEQTDEYGRLKSRRSFVNNNAAGSFADPLRSSISAFSDPEASTGEKIGSVFGFGAAFGNRRADRFEKRATTERINNENQGADIGNSDFLYMKDGGQIPMPQMINVEKGELLSSPEGKILKEYRNKPLHPNKGINIDGNTKEQPGTYVIPRKMSTLFKEGDKLRRNTILMNLQNKQAATNKMEEGGPIGNEWSILPNDTIRTQSILDRYKLKNGLTPDYIVHKKQVVDKPQEEGWLDKVDNVLSAPQRAATYALTGKYQNPSEALGIKNEWGKMAVDMVLDPMNLLGVGTVTKGLGKVAAKVLGTTAEHLDEVAKLADKAPLDMHDYGKVVDYKKYKDIILETPIHDFNKYKNYKDLDVAKYILNDQVLTSSDKILKLNKTGAGAAIINDLIKQDGTKDIKDSYEPHYTFPNKTNNTNPTNNINARQPTLSVRKSLKTISKQVNTKSQSAPVLHADSFPKLGQDTMMVDTPKQGTPEKYMLSDGNKYTYEELIKRNPALKDPKTFERNFGKVSPELQIGTQRKMKNGGMVYKAGNGMRIPQEQPYFNFGLDTYSGIPTDNVQPYQYSQVTDYSASFKPSNTLNSQRGSAVPPLRDPSLKVPQNASTGIPERRRDYSNTFSDIGGTIANNFGPLAYLLGEGKKYDKVNYGRVNPDLLDPREELAQNQLENNSLNASIRDASGGNTGSYLTNRIVANRQNYINKAKTLRDYANTNAGIKNQFKQYNKANDIRAQEAEAQNKGVQTENYYKALYNMGQNTAGSLSDIKKRKQDEEMLKLYSNIYQNYDFDPNTYTFTRKKDKTKD